MVEPSRARRRGPSPRAGTPGHILGSPAAPRRSPPAAAPAARTARISPSVFLRGSIRPTKRTNGSGPHRSRNDSGEAVPNDGEDAVGNDADSLARQPRRDERADSPRPRIGQDDIGQPQQLAPPARQPGRDRVAGPRPPGPRPSARGRSRARPEARGSIPADRREHDGNPARPRHPGQLEPLARHPEKMEQPGRLEAVGPRREEPDADAERFEMHAGLDQLVLAAARRLEGERRRVQEDRTRRASAPAARRAATTRWTLAAAIEMAAGDRGSSCAPVPARLCFHHLSPRLTRFGERRPRDVVQRRHGLPVDRGPDRPASSSGSRGRSSGGSSNRPRARSLS